MKKSWKKRHQELINIYKQNTTAKYLSGSLEIKPKEQILYLGCSFIEPIKILKEKGADVLVLCVDEEGLINVRREGIGAILMNAEYIPYINRFDKVVAEDIFYLIDCPSKALKNIVNALKPEGEAWIEMVVGEGNLLIKELIWQLLRENGYLYRLYSPSYPRKEKVIESIPKENLLEFEAKLKYKTEVITLKRGFDWLKPYIKIASSHLCKDKQIHFEKLLKVTLQKRLKESLDNSLVMEYTVLRIKMKKA